MYTPRTASCRPPASSRSAIAMGLFGVADFLLNVNRINIAANSAKVRVRDMLPTRAELKTAFWPMVCGTA